MRVVVTHPIPEEGIPLLKEKGYEVTVGPEGSFASASELHELIRGADAVLALLTDKVDSAFFEAAGPGLKVVANYAVGYDNIDLEEAGRRGVKISNTPDVLSQAVAEHTFTLITAAARRVAEADRYVRAGRYRGWEPDLLLGMELKGKVLGVVGLGRIGSIVAGIAHRGYEMEVVYHDIKPNPEFEKEFSATKHPLEGLLGRSDVVSIHVPLLPATHHLIGREELKRMKKTAILVNTSRGPVVDEAALALALKEGEIAGAGLDVFEKEPGLSPGLVELENAVLTPHIASATVEARGAMSRLAAENIVAALEGTSLPSEVKPGK